MNRIQLFLASLLWGIVVATAAAQPQDVSNSEIVDSAVHALDVVSSRMSAYLNAMPSFRVQTSTSWKLDGENERDGGSHCKLRVRHPSAFHLQFASDADDALRLECASDGETLTRLYRSDSLSIYSRHDGGLPQLLEDSLTNGSLQGTGLELLVRPDLHRYLMASISQLKDLGNAPFESRAAHHFSATWLDGSQVEFWIAADREPVLLRWKRRLDLRLGGGQPHQLQIDTHFKWAPDTAFSAAQAIVRLPADAVQVKDLQSYLLKGGTDQLLGKMAPDVSLKLLDGSDWNVKQHRGNELVVLFFFATWAVPSTRDMPAVFAYIDEHQGREVAFYAVDVGETPETVQAFIAAQKYSHPVVLDPQEEAAPAYRVTSLPVTVLIGKDGSVQAVHVGTSPDELTRIVKDLQHLLAGKQLVSEKGEE